MSRTPGAAVGFAAIGLASGVEARVMAPVPALNPVVSPVNFYIGPEAGWTDLMTARNATDAAATGPDNGKAAISFEDFAAGYNVGGRAGVQWGPWRFETEISYRRNDSLGVRQVSPETRPGLGAGSERHSLSELVNAIYDFDVGWPITPHIGGGLGAAEVTRNLSNKFGGTHDTATAFAYQAIGGIRYPIGPALALDIDYRYFATADMTFISTNPSLIKSDYGTHNVLVSLTWQFGSVP